MLAVRCVISLRKIFGKPAGDKVECAKLSRSVQLTLFELLSNVTRTFIALILMIVCFECVCVLFNFIFLIFFVFIFYYFIIVVYCLSLVYKSIINE